MVDGKKTEDALKDAATTFAQVLAQTGRNFTEDGFDSLMQVAVDFVQDSARLARIEAKQDKVALLMRTYAERFAINRDPALD